MNKNNMESKLNINWYPGHMAKTKREITEDLKLIDAVIEILDARIPVSSQNPDIQKVIQNKKKIILLNKYDLSDETETKKWQGYFKAKGIPAVLINANDGKGMNQVIDAIQDIMKEEMEQESKKGRIGKIIRCAVIRCAKCWKIIIYKQNIKEKFTKSSKQTRSNSKKTMDTFKQEYRAFRYSWSIMA